MLSPATIPQSSFHAFTTDHQSKWSSTLSSQAASAPLLQHSFTQDFQLFETPTTQPAPHLSPSQATSSTVLNSRIPQQRRQLDPAVAPAPSHVTTSPHILNNNYRSYSSPLLLQQQRQFHQQRVARLHRQRPPVPLFHETQTTPDNYSPVPVQRRRVQSASNLQGNSHWSLDPTITLTSESDPTMASVFDNISFSGNAYHEDLFADLGDGMSMTNFNTVPSNESSFDEMQPHTVSPKDLWADEYVTSAPPSTAFPPLGTPGSEFLDSPALTGGLDTTPMEDGFLDGQLNNFEVDQWPSLFPEDTVSQFVKPTASPAIVQNNSFDSLTNVQSSAIPATPTMTRQKSSPGRPPMTAAHLRKHSLSSGIVKSAAKPRKSLPEISIDSEDDKETAKRKKNTAAARKSRERKQMIVESQAAEIDRLRELVINLGGNPDP